METTLWLSLNFMDEEKLRGTEIPWEDLLADDADNRFNCPRLRSTERAALINSIVEHTTEIPILESMVASLEELGEPSTVYKRHLTRLKNLVDQKVKTLSEDNRRRRMFGPQFAS